MRTVKQVKVINSQLEVLEELKEQLQSVLTYIDNVLLKGISWIKEEENGSFKEINHFLTNETSECFQRCLNLANGDDEWSQPSCTREEDKATPSVFSSISTSSSSPTSLTENQTLTEKIMRVEKIIAKQSKTLKAMKQKYSEQSKETAETVRKLKEDMEEKSDSKLKEILTELHAASNFMSDLQTKNELLTNQVNENVQQHNNMEQKLNSFAKENVCKDDSAHPVGLDEINKRVSNNCDDIKEIKDQNESTLTCLKTVEKRLDDLSLLVDPLKTSCQVHREKEDLNIQIGNVATQVEEMLQRIINIESTDVYVGFDACAEENNFFCGEDEILTCFTDLDEDYDCNFDTDTGKYTVHINGIYLCAVFIELISFVKHDMKFEICVNLSDDGDEEVTGNNEVTQESDDEETWGADEESDEDEEEDETTIASCHTEFRGQTMCALTVRELHSGDQLYVKYRSNRHNIKLNESSHFMCVLMNPVKS